MQLEIHEKLLDELAILAKTQKRSVNAILADAIKLYLRTHDDHAAFRQVVQQTIQEHQELLDELAGS